MKEFTCNCGGIVKVITDDKVLHSCKNKYAPSETYYTGVDKFIPYRRVQINPRLTSGEVKYNWFVDWQTKEVK